MTLICLIEIWGRFCHTQSYTAHRIYTPASSGRGKTQNAMKDFLTFLSASDTAKEIFEAYYFDTNVGQPETEE